MINFNILFSFFLVLLTQQGFAIVTNWSSSLPDQMTIKKSSSLKDEVQFWKKIYSEISEQEAVFHNPLNLSEIYLIQKIPSRLKSQAQIRAWYEIQKIKIRQKQKMASYRDIRVQTGLKERMQKALMISGQYLPMMESVFASYGLPIELTRLVFVESSFNIFAQSKVGASGLWQIMPSVGQESNYLHFAFDKRNHPYYATVLAAQILKKNYRSTLGSIKF